MYSLFCVKVLCVKRMNSVYMHTYVKFIFTEAPFCMWLFLGNSVKVPQLDPVHHISTVFFFSRVK